MDEQNQPKKRGCFFYGCAFALVGGGIFAAALIGLFLYGKSIIGPTADDYLQHIDKNEYTQAYAMTSTAFKAATSEAQFTAFAQRMQQTFGTCQSKTLDGIAANTTLGKSTSVMNYSAQFTKGAATLTFNLIKEDGVWKIERVDYKSPLLQTPAAPESPTAPETPAENPAPETSAPPKDSVKAEKPDVPEKAPLTGSISKIGQAASVEPQANVDVVLTKMGDSKIMTIKLVRDLTGLGLKDAKDLVESLPHTLKTGVAREDAERMKRQFETLHATVEFK